MTYLDRGALLALFTDLQETDFTHTHLGGQKLRIRELTAQQVHDARTAARVTGEWDTMTFNTIAIQQGVIDGPGGQPFLSPLDVAAILQGRNALTERLANAIWELSEATPAAFRTPRAGTDGGGDAGAGAGGAAAEPGAGADGA